MRDAATLIARVSLFLSSIMSSPFFRKMNLSQNGALTDPRIGSAQPNMRQIRGFDERGAAQHFATGRAASQAERQFLEDVGRKAGSASKKAGRVRQAIGGND
jgi:hypothetical protein